MLSRGRDKITDRKDSILDLFDFGFPTNTPFHPEGFILTMIINGKSVYCKLKSATYYLCHASIEKLLKCPEKMKKVMELPEHVKYWFPVVGQVKELQDSIDKLLPEFSSLVMKEFKIIVDQFIGILDKYKGTVYISKMLQCVLFLLI